MKIFKKIGKVLAGAVKVKLNVVSGNLAGAAKAAKELVKDTVELFQGSQRSGRFNASLSQGPQQAHEQHRIQQTFGANVSSIDLSMQRVADHRDISILLVDARTVDAPPSELGALPTERTNDAVPPEEMLNYVGTTWHTIDAPRSGGKTSAAEVLRDPGPPSPSDGQALLELLESNPKAFQEAWKDMGESDRQLAMMNLQRQLQAVQQLTTIMTNMLQSQHGAAMSVARNLAV